ncbi:serine hydrolase [Latilactobacillus curvatus]|uniref:serine hydrolase n=1 Tax=Latilactobacillus curvatus TaxID=28038 RepID=UPI003AF1331B
MNTPDTLYAIGSTEKALIATSLLQLQEQGKLNVNDPISRYLPDFPNGQQIKLTDFYIIHQHCRSDQDNQTKTLDQLIEEIIKNGLRNNRASGTIWMRTILC